MTDIPSASQDDTQAAPRWRPLCSIDRRVVGVLAEKAKTTPDAYPMSLNAVTTGCNQKSNRAPLMNLELDDVEQSLDRLRDLGAVGIVQGYGRVSKYRHYLYEWLGVDKMELAVMTELLLRGEQTEGELRGRAARMEPITGLDQLRPILTSLESKGLLVSLTPSGRGHVVTHALYQPAELEKLKAQYQHGAPQSQPHSSPVTQTAGAVASEALMHEVKSLRNELAALRADVDALRSRVDETNQSLAHLQDALDATGT